MKYIHAEIYNVIDIILFSLHLIKYIFVFAVNIWLKFV